MSSEKHGILLINLGSPDEPTLAAVKRYLTQFLSDPRVIEMNRPLWYVILRTMVLPKRVPEVTKLYQSIWTEDGAPLVANSIKQQKALSAHLPKDLPVEIGMTYSSPSITDALNRLMEQKVTNIMILPLFPQYSATTTGSIWDIVSKELSKLRNLPTIHFIRDYADHPLYIEALATSIRDAFEHYGEPDMLFFSYHGLPKRYVEKGDNYPKRCQITTEAVATLLDLDKKKYQMCWQSTFGKEEWLAPLTVDILKELPKQGIRNVHVICPGFASDCLETLEEVAQTYKKIFLNAGGEHYQYIPALNNSPMHIRLIQQLTTCW